MHRPRFRLWHSILGTGALVLVQLACMRAPTMAAEALVLVCAAVGTALTIFVTTEAIEEVRGSRPLFFTLSLVLAQFVLYFAFEFWLLDIIQPAAFPTLANGVTDYLLASLMVFVLNPLYLPATVAGRLLLIIETLGALGLVLFVLQNISQLRPRTLDRE